MEECVKIEQEKERLKEIYIDNLREGMKEFQYETQLAREKHYDQLCTSISNNIEHLRTIKEVLDVFYSDMVKLQVKMKKNNKRADIRTKTTFIIGSLLYISLAIWLFNKAIVNSSWSEFEPYIWVVGCIMAGLSVIMGVCFKKENLRELVYNFLFNKFLEWNKVHQNIINDVYELENKIREMEYKKSVIEKEIESLKADMEPLMVLMESLESAALSI